MSSIVIRDLALNAALDSRAMSAVRGGIGPAPAVNVNVTVSQQVAQFQQIGVNVLNNNAVIGASFAVPDLKLAASQWTANRAAAPAL